MSTPSGSPLEFEPGVWRNRPGLKPVADHVTPAVARTLERRFGHLEHATVSAAEMRAIERISCAPLFRSFATRAGITPARTPRTRTPRARAAAHRPAARRTSSSSSSGEDSSGSAEPGDEPGEPLTASVARELATLRLRLLAGQPEPFTFERFARLTPNRLPHERAEMFGHLPPIYAAQCWEGVRLEADRKTPA